MKNSYGINDYWYALIIIPALALLICYWGVVFLLCMIYEALAWIGIVK